MLTGRGAGTLKERRHIARRTVGFDAAHVHDVRNMSARAAVSVHAYSRPLTSMTFYDVDHRGALAPVLTFRQRIRNPDLELGSAR